MNTNKVIGILLILGIAVILFLGIDILRKSEKDNPLFDFSEVTRPILYDKSPSRGLENAKVVMYEYGDFSCASCKAMQPIVNQIMLKYSSQILHVWKDFPFISQDSKDSAVAARCAQEQGMFWEYHDKLFENKGLISNFNLNLDKQSFTSCLQDDTIANLVERDFAEGRALGIEATPTIVIGDVAIVGVVEFEDIEQAILNAILR